MAPVKIGLIGLGFMGTTHFGIYRNLPDAQVAAIADLDPAKRAGDISKVCGNIGEGEGAKLDLAGVAVYADAFQMIAEADVDVIDICVPTPWHHDYILAALAAGRHVFTEKPVCRNLAELDRIAAAVAQSPKYFNVGMCIRTWPEYEHARTLLRSGRAGKLQSAFFRRLSPSVDGNGWKNWYLKEARSGGALLDLHLHDTDAICHFFGNPKAVSTFGARGIISDSGFDHVLTNYLYGDGTLIAAEGGWGAAKGIPFEMSFQLICEKATLKLDPTGYRVYWTDGRVETPVAADPALPTGWHRELAYFVRCVRDGVRPDKYQTPQQVFDSFRVAMAEEESAKTGKIVEVHYV